MRAVFRFDASPALGAGHAYRCMTLARALAQLGWHCHGIVNREAVDTVPALRNNPSLTLSGIADCERRGADLLVVDHYGLDAGWESACRGWARQILVIDDLADRQHDCDLLLDQTLGRRANDYAGLIPAKSTLLTGSDFALLRADFARSRQASLHRRGNATGLKRILVSLGATDPGNHSLVALQAIAASGLPLQVDVVLGAAAPHREAVAAQIAEMPQQTELHINIENMPALMKAADLAIGAAGTSTWERCCLGLPSLLLVIAENQRLTAETVDATGAARLIPGPRAEMVGQIADALGVLAADGEALQAMATQAAKICDGRGCDRLGLALVRAGRAKNGRPVSLRLAEAADEDLVLQWQRHPTTRRFSRNPQVPSAAEHHRWFQARLADPDCLLTLITLDGAPAGVLRLDSAEPRAAALEAQAFEISILVSPEHRGLGIALEALQFARRWQQNAAIIAEVLPGNDASTALFKAARYEPGAKGLLYSYPRQTEAALSG